MADFFAVWFQLLSIPEYPSHIPKTASIKDMGYQNARADYNEKYPNQF